MKSTHSTAKQQKGFTITQMVITLAIIAVVSVFGVLGIKSARAEFQQQSAARLFASYVEKARADAIRRHAATGEESSVETFGPDTTSYAVTMDWGDGVVETRTFDLDDGLTFDTDARKVSFDWRGRIAEAWVFQIRSKYLDKNLPVDVSGSGDITVGEQHFPDQSIPDVTISQVTGDVATPTPTPTPSTEEPSDPDPGSDTETNPEETTPPADSGPGSSGDNGNPGDNGNGGDNNGGDNNGGGNGNNDNGDSDPDSNTDPTIPQCASSISPSFLSLSQSDTSKLTASATFTMTNATGVRIISASQAGHGNAVTISVSLQRIDGNGSSVITVGAKHGGGNRGQFVVDVSADPSCGSTQKLTVRVDN